MLSSLIRFFTSLTRRGSPALWDHGGEDPLLAMFRKLRFTMEHRRGGKKCKRDAQRGGKKNEMAEDGLRFERGRIDLGNTVYENL